MNGKIDKVSIDRLKRAYVEDLIDSSKTEKKASEILTDANTEPLKAKRGRPTRDEQAARTDERRAERERQEEIEHEKQDQSDREFPPISTRSGRTSRPPDRL